MPYYIWVAPTDQGPWAPIGYADSTGMATVMQLLGSQIPRSGRYRWLYCFDPSLKRSQLVDTLTTNRWASNDGGKTWQSVAYA